MAWVLGCFAYGVVAQPKMANLGHKDISIRVAGDFCAYVLQAGRKRADAPPRGHAEIFSWPAILKTMQRDF